MTDATGRPDTGDGVVIFAGLDYWYHNKAHADFQLATRLAGTRRVLLVNSIGTRLPMPGRSSSTLRRIRRKLGSVLRGVRRPIPGLPDFYVYSPFVLPAYGSAAGRRLATALVRLQVGVVTRRLGMRTPSVLVTPPTAWEAVRRMRRRTLVYNRSDKHSAWTEVHGPTIERYERELLRHADTVLYVSEALMDADSALVGDRAVFLDHGVDTELFRPGLAPAPELAGVPGPRIGYFGAFRDYTVDAELLRRIATELPDCSIVLVGPSTMDLSAVEALPNVYRFGTQPHERIPEFGAGFDVAIMPWLDNDWIRHCNPIKLKEYLALGLPVVTTDFAEAHRWPVRTARGAEQFVAAVRDCLAHPGDAAARRDSVAGESWDARVDLLVNKVL